MKRALLLGYMLLLALLSLNAQEFAIRKADDLRLESFTFKTASNSHFVFWSDLSQGRRVIWCQNIDSGNSATISDAVRLAHSSGDQKLVAVTPTTDGKFLALWAEMEIDQILQYRAQKMSPNGDPLWGEQGVLVADINGEMMEAFMVKNDIGGAFVVFQKSSLLPVMAQKLDEHGNLLWTAEGKELLGDSTHYFLEEVVEDAAGGLITNSRHIQDIFTVNRLHRFDPSGEPTGPAPLISPDAFPSKSYKIFPPVDGKFTVYQKLTDSSNSLRIFKIDADGVPYVSPSNHIQFDDQYYNTFKSIVPTPEGGVAIAWHRWIIDSYSQHFVQKYSPTFEELWSQPTEIFDGVYETALIDIFPSETGNLWLCCLDTRQQRNLRGQLLDNLGNPLLGSQGVLLSESGQQAIALTDQNLGIFLCNSLESGYKKLKVEAYTHAGTPVQNSGEINLPSRLNYNCRILGSYSLGDRFLSLWLDLKDYYKLCYQIYDQDMNALLETNGRAVCPTSSGNIEFKDYVITADNKLALIYETTDYSSQPYLRNSYLQIIDAGGNLHYPEYGLLLDFENMENPRLGKLSDGILVGWIKARDQDYQIRAQKYVNGQAQWESSGKLICQALNTERLRLTHIIENYILWESYLHHAYSKVCKALKVNDNGELEDGWDPAGVRLLTGHNFENENIYHVGKVGDDLLAFLHFSELFNYNVRAQKLSPNGQRLWGDGGSIIGGNNDWKYIHSVVFGEDSYFLISFLGTSIFLSKIDAQGIETSLGQEEEIVAWTNNCYDATLIRFENGSMLCAFSDNDGALIQNRDLYIRHISSLGIPQAEAPIPFCTARYKQNFPHMAVFGNKAFISWQDDRAGIIDSEEAWTGIWGNSILSAFSDVSDPSISPVLYPKITANYPNPFNPSTRISFELPAPGQVKLSVYNLKGQLVKKLIDGNTFSAGTHSVTWDGTDNRGKTLSSGVYLGRLSCGNKSDTIKMVLAK